MFEISKEAFPALAQILEAWDRRNEFRALRDAAQDSAPLGFWRDGMLAQLKLVASGDRSEKTFIELERRFNESKEPVTRLFERLRRVRAELGRSSVSEQIDVIINHDQFGKRTIRREIASIIKIYKSIHPSIGGRVKRKVYAYLGIRDENYVGSESSTESWRDIENRARAVCQSIDAAESRLKCNNTFKVLARG
jgi:hypothetical protein